MISKENYTQISNCYDFANKLKELIGHQKVSTRMADCQAYMFVSGGIDQPLVRPEVVVIPETPEDIAATVRLANEFRIPVTPRGQGSGVLGMNVPLYGGVVLDVSRMNKILAIDHENMVAIVECGVTVNSLFEALDREGLRLPVRTWLDAYMQLGAWAACNGNGDFANEFGTSGCIVVGLEVVLPTGEIIRLGSWAREGGYGAWIRYPGGPDMIGLFTGSIGGLGVITKVIYRVIKRPNYMTYLSFGWPRDNSIGMSRAVYELMNYGVSNISLHTYWVLRGALRSGLISMPESIYFVANVMQGAYSEAELKARRDSIIEIATSYGLQLDDNVCKVLHGPPRYFLNLGHFNHFRKRPKVGRGLTWAMFYYYNPVLKFPETWDLFERVCEKYKFTDKNRGPCLFAWAIPPQALAPFPTFGYYPSQPEEVERMKMAWDEINNGLMDMGCVPYSLGSFMPKEKMKQALGSGYDLLQKIKKTLDPQNIMNPGQLLEPRKEEA